MTVFSAKVPKIQNTKHNSAANGKAHESHFKAKKCTTTKYRDNDVIFFLLLRIVLRTPLAFVKTLRPDHVYEPCERFYAGGIEAEAQMRI